MQCPNCNADIPEGSKFCLECGTALLGCCPSCGNANPASAKFCLECGHKLPATGVDAAGRPATDTATLQPAKAAGSAERRWPDHARNDAFDPFATSGGAPCCACQVPFPARRSAPYPLKSPEPMLSTKKCSNFQEDHFNTEGADFIPKTKTCTARCEQLCIFHRA